MGASRRTLGTLVVVGATVATVAACDALIGLGDYSKVSCAIDCGTDASEGGEVSEGGVDSTTDALDAGTGDAADAADALVVDSAADEGPGDVSVGDGPEPSTLWAQWFMPNPEAGIAPEASTLLPHTMAYDAGADGGSTTAFDLQTGLTWQRVPVSATSLLNAETACASLGTGWMVPTRIQLVSLIDFTQPVTNATVDQSTFPGVPSQRLWTSSVYPSDAGALHWFVDFSTGLTVTGNASTGSQVLCVRGP